MGWEENTYKRITSCILITFCRDPYVRFCYPALICHLWFIDLAFMYIYLFIFYIFFLFVYFSFFLFFFLFQCNLFIFSFLLQFSLFAAESLLSWNLCFLLGFAYLNLLSWIDLLGFAWEINAYCIMCKSIVAVFLTVYVVFDQ